MLSMNQPCGFTDGAQPDPNPSASAIAGRQVLITPAALSAITQTMQTSGTRHRGTLTLLPTARFWWIDRLTVSPICWLANTWAQHSNDGIYSGGRWSGPVPYHSSLGIRPALSVGPMWCTADRRTGFNRSIHRTGLLAGALMFAVLVPLVLHSLVCRERSRWLLNT